VPADMKNKLSQRLQRSLATGVGLFALSGAAYKLGLRGKYGPGATVTTWSELVAVLPSLAVLSALVAGTVYFWLGRSQP
jgi:hypothetical protein